MSNKTVIQKAASIMGRAGIGDSKRRTPDQCRKAQKESVKARRRNKHIRIGREIAAGIKRKHRKQQSMITKRTGKKWTSGREN